MKGKMVEILLEEFIFYQRQKDSKVIRKEYARGVIIECLADDYYIVKLLIKEEPEHKFHKSEFRVLL
jgi:hypothetical protein